MGRPRPDMSRDRPRVAEAVPPYLALKLGGTVWVGVPELPRLFLTGAEPATRC